jgi:5-methylthioadenosine/S-adenosylhomocysteine deaminase
MSKAHFDRNDWLVSARLGAIESIAAGVTTIGDNTDAGVTAQVAAETGLRAVIYQEVFGIDDRESVEPIVEELRRKIGDLRKFESDRIQIGVSPHALYTVRPALFAALAADPELSSLPWSIHIAESAAESELTEQGTGAFAEMYARRGINWQSPRTSPTAYAQSMGALRPTGLAVHCVHQSPEDIDIVKRSGAAVVHCPKSNGKLAAGCAPLAEWLTAGVPIALGTDSAVSNNTLDMFEEMRFAVLGQRARTEKVEAVTARDIVRIATLGGAEALGLSSMTGSLMLGKRADIIAVDLSGPHSTPSTDPYAALVYASRANDVMMTMCGGRILYDRGQWPTVDADLVMRSARVLRENLEKKRNG